MMTICKIGLPVVVIWHILFIFVFSDSRYQTYRFRKALDNIFSHVIKSTKNDKCELDVIHRNKKFTVSLNHRALNAVYEYYEIFINDEFVATFHMLENPTWFSKYRFRNENDRYSREIKSVIYAADKLLKQEAKPKKEHKDGYVEHSYFK